MSERALTCRPRRRVLQVLAGSAVLGPSEWLHAQAAAYQLLTLSKKNLPMTTVADCKTLEAAVKHFANESTRAGADPAGYGSVVMGRLAGQRAQLQKTIADAKRAHASANLSLTLQHVNTALSITFLGLGVAFGGPVAFGVLAAATVLTGVAAFGVQATFVAGGTEPVMVFGFVRDRTLMFAQLGAQDAATAAGRLIGNAAAAAALFITAYEYDRTYADQAKARSALALAVPRLEGLDAALTELGTDPKAWGEMAAKVHAAARDQLQAYINNTRASSCMLLPTPGPTLRKP